MRWMTIQKLDKHGWVTDLWGIQYFVTGLW